MAETDDPDSLLEAFSRKITAVRNLRSLEGKSKKEGRAAPSEDDEEHKPPFKPSPV